MGAGLAAGPVHLPGQAGQGEAQARGQSFSSRVGAVQMFPGQRVPLPGLVWQVRVEKTMGPVVAQLNFFLWGLLGGAGRPVLAFWLFSQQQAEAGSVCKVQTWACGCCQGR